MKALYLLSPARRALLLWTAIFCFFVPCIAFAQTEEPKQQDQSYLRLTLEQALSVVSQLIVAGKVEEAFAVLNQIKGQTQDPEQEQFLAAQIAIRQQKYAEALSIYDALLAANANLIRIRIERARLLVAMGDAEAANAEFADIRKTDLSDGLSGYVDRLLAATQQRQPWTFSITAAGQYDSNASAGPDQDTVTLFGLPFTLSPDAREASAWGANISATGSYLWSLSEDWDVRATGGVSHTDVEQGQFDDSLATAQVSVAHSSSDYALAFGPTAYRRWFAGSGLSTAWGTQGVFDLKLGASWRLASVLSVQDVSYDSFDDRDGLVGSFTVRASHSLSPSSAIFIHGGLAHEGADARPLRNTVYRLGAAYAYRWTSGAQVTLRPEVAFRDFEGVQPAFRAKRHDWRISAGIDLKAPPISGSRLAPFVSYSFVENDSTIDFNSYTRHQIRIGVAFEL